MEKIQNKLMAILLLVGLSLVSSNNLNAQCNPNPTGCVSTFHKVTGFNGIIYNINYTQCGPKMYITSITLSGSSTALVGNELSLLLPAIAQQIPGINYVVFPGTCYSGVATMFPFSDRGYVGTYIKLVFCGNDCCIFDEAYMDDLNNNPPPFGGITIGTNGSSNQLCPQSGCTYNICNQ